MLFRVVGRDRLMETVIKFQLVPMGFLAPGSVHACSLLRPTSTLTGICQHTCLGCVGLGCGGKNWQFFKLSLGDSRHLLFFFNQKIAQYIFVWVKTPCKTLGQSFLGDKIPKQKREKTPAAQTKRGYFCSISTENGVELGN
jgi:hypothetical protein